MHGTQRVFEYNGFWLHQRRDTPHFHIYWCRPGTRRVRRKSTGTSDLESAKRSLIRFADTRRQPTPTAPDSVSLLACLTDYVQPMISVARLWLPERTALLHWSRFIEQEDLVAVSDLTLDMQSRYIAWRREANQSGRPLSNATLNRELGVMNAAIRHAWKLGKLTHPVHIRLLQNPRPRQRFLFVEEARKLLNAPDALPHMRTYVALALHTLQRPSAILALRAEQVRFAEGLIDFLPEGDIQSKKRRPVVPISDTLRPILHEAIARSRSGHVVEFHGKPIRHIRKGFQNFARRAGVTDVNPYTLRHTGATLLLASGVPIRQVAGMLGHTEQRTTEMYGKHHPSFLNEAKAATDRLFGSVVESQTN